MQAFFRELWKASHIPPAICLAFLLLFFSFLPDLNRCRLPAVRTRDQAKALTRREAFRVFLVTAVYAVFAFWNLGNLASPERFVPMADRSVVLMPASAEAPAKLMLFTGVGQGEYSIEVSEDQQGWLPVASFRQDHVSVLKWNTVDLELDSPAAYLRLRWLSGTPWLGELVLFDGAGERIAFSCSEENLHDEGDLVPEKQTYHNSSYFDEIYHARTAWEHLHDVWPYELSHPPLGKELLSLGILLFGMTPFGWRFSGTLTGVLMLPVMYIFLKRLFGGRRIPLLGTVLLASGFLHYTQTRIATIDSFSVLFILLMYCFMYGWLSDDSPADLALCGFSFGLGIACKWICFYAGAGLALLWIGHWIRAFVLAAREKRPLPAAAFLRNVPFCLFFFILIPGLIYYLSYLPYGRVKGFPVFSEPYTRLVLENQTFMFDYHSRLVAQHPYASRWYQWILNIRPILYYLEYLPDGRHIDIAAFNNPLICWGGLMSLAVLLWEAVTRRDRTAAFLLTAYLAELVPWVFITRLTFAYHYFAASVFLVPALCYLFWIMEKASPRRKYVTLAFTAVSVFLFLFFFPVLCGLPVDNGKSKLVFSWLPTWPI